VHDSVLNKLISENLRSRSVLQQVYADLSRAPANTVICSSSQSDKHGLFCYLCVILHAKTAFAKVRGRETLKVTSHVTALVKSGVQSTKQVCFRLS